MQEDLVRTQNPRGTHEILRSYRMLNESDEGGCLGLFDGRTRMSELRLWVSSTAILSFLPHRTMIRWQCTDARRSPGGTYLVTLCHRIVTAATRRRDVTGEYRVLIGWRITCKIEFGVPFCRMTRGTCPASVGMHLITPFN